MLTTPSAKTPNNNVQAFVIDVGDEIAQLLSALQLPELYTQLSVPKVNDGNNLALIKISAPMCM